MQKAQIYIAQTPAGNYKAYAVGYANDYDGNPDNTEYNYKPLPDQPLRGFTNPTEVSGYIQNKFTAEHVFDEWSTKQAGDGSQLNKNMDGWQIFSWSNPHNPQLAVETNNKQKVEKMPRPRKKRVEVNPVYEAEEEIEQEDETDDSDEYYEDDSDVNEPEIEPKPIKQRKKRVKKQNRRIQSSNENTMFVGNNQPMQPQTFPQNTNVPSNNMFYPFAQQQTNRLSYEQYKQLVEGVVQVFENTIMIAASYSMAINSVTLAHAYRAVKLIGSYQFYPAYDAIRIASTHDNMWINLRDSIIQVNRTIGMNI